MANEKIVTLYDTLAHAEAAERNLIKAGLNENSISLIQSQDIDRSDLEGEQSIWRRLFGDSLTDEDRAIYSEAVQNNGTILTVHVDEEDRAKALAILNRHQISDDSRYASRTVAGTAAAGTVATGVAATNTIPTPSERVGTVDTVETYKETRPHLTGDESQDEILQLAREDLEVGKRIEQEGSTRIRRYVVERDVSETVNLREQHAEVLRRKVDRPVTDGNIDWSDKEVSVEEYSEKPVVNKNAKVVEEVVVKKVNTDRDEVVTDTVREQKVDVDGTGKNKVIDETRK